MAFSRYELLTVMYLSYFSFVTDLNKFLNKLDERYEAKVKKQGMLMAKKARKIGSFASSVPPLETPGWTIDKEWKKSETQKISLYIFTLNVFY